MKTNKKYFNRLAGGAVLLAGAMAFSACSSDEDFAEGVAPGTGVIGQTVKTQFAINIPYAGGPEKRMSQVVTQGLTTPAFRGMSNIYLIPFALGTTPSESGKPVVGTTPLSYNVIKLGNITTAATATEGLLSESNAHVYQDVNINVGVNAFLFYGEATSATQESGLTTEQTNGVLNPSYLTEGLNVGDNVSEITFSLQNILGTVDEVRGAETALAAMLTAIANTTGTNSTDKWENAEGSDLQQYYTSFTSLKAGSANSIRLALQDLYNAMGSPRVEDENGLKAAIQAEIEEYFDVTPSTTEGGDATLSYKSGTSVSDYATYPVYFYLPDGAVQVVWSDDDKSFSYADNITYPGGEATVQLNVAALTDYTYPASLYYWTNSSIKTSVTQQSNNYGTNNWSTILNLYDNGRVVQASTQSIAMEQSINYGVARLDLNAAFASSAIPDKNQDLVNLPANGFQLVGLLIGGQKKVGWDFAPMTGSNVQEQTIYDAAVPANTYVNRTSALKNQTLVLETEDDDDSKTVNIALEFVNNGSEPFEGIDGIVPVGGKFYLVGQLKADETHTKVFQQDYYTTATVTINSLKNAYNCIPDLRSPKLELGLSVDLVWQRGLEADVTID